MIQGEGKIPQTQKIGVVGLGFVGLPLALLFVSKGFEVIGYDLDKRKIDKLEKGKSYIPDLSDEELKAAKATNRFSATVDYNLIYHVDVIVICVPTPLTPHRTPDLSCLQEAGGEIGARLRKGQSVILESSTYPGATKEVLKPILEKSGLVVGKDIYLGYSPERIDLGNRAYSIDQIPKVVSGVTEACAAKVYELYSQVFTKVVTVSSTEVAEFTKLLGNCHRYINISFMNDLAILCKEMSINIWEVIDVASTKSYGFTPFYPGVGSHSIPIDPLYLLWKASKFRMNS